MAKKNVADLLVDTLVARGVERIYGVAGDSLNGITDSIRQQEADSLDPRAARGDGRVCRRGRRASDGTIGGLRRELRAREPAPDQRALRLPPQPRARARHRRADSQPRDRDRLFPGNPPRASLRASAATTANWFPSPSRCPACWRSPSRRRSRGAASRCIALPGDVALRDAVEQEPRLHFPAADAHRVPVR